MPGTPQEFVDLATSDSLMPVGLRWADGTELTDDDRQSVLAVRVYEARIRRARRHRGRVQNRAMAMFRSLLTPRQRAELTSSGCVVLTLASGNAYRIIPKIGGVERVTRHGTRWFVAERFCIHDEQDDDAMPPADLATAHLLLLLASEDEFLATANARNARDQLWNREYLARMRERIA
jgi:uncharacterized protein YeaC (DUF1315 family)